MKTYNDKNPSLQRRLETAETKLAIWKKHKSVIEARGGNTDASDKNIKRFEKLIEDLKNEIHQKELDLQNEIINSGLMICPSFPQLFVKDDEVYRIKFGKVVKQKVYTDKKSGYHMVKNPETNNNETEHRVIADAYYGPCPQGSEVDHIDFNRGNNKHENLRYISWLENRRRRRPFKKDKPKQEPKPHIRYGYWWTNGITDVRRNECPGEGWKLGRTKGRKKNENN